MTTEELQAYFNMQDICASVRYVYNNMLNRCRNPKAHNYKYYGGRGIKVCQRWTESIKNFAQDMGPRPAEYTLDRIDNNGNYEPENCRWASRVVQARNRTGAITVTVLGETKCLAAWAKDARCRASKDALYKRMQAGWDGGRAVTEPMDRGNRRGAAQRHRKAVS